MHLFLLRFHVRGGLQLIALLCAMMAGTSSIHAATITVTNTADNGPGSLRAAILAASNGDTIQFDPALNGQSIMLTSTELTIDKNLTIYGPGANQLAVKKGSGTPEFHIFRVLLGRSLIIVGLTIDGNATMGAGVWNDRAQVALDGCVVQGCLRHGGVRSFASFNDDSYLTVVNSIITHNQADTAGGGIYNEACCTANLAHALVSIRGSVISENIVGNCPTGLSCTASGGGIFNSGEMDITNSIVSGNVSGGNGPNVPFGNGGGISNQPLAGSLYITNCTISGNSAGFNGGGIYNTAFTFLTGSTLSGNAANGINDLEGWGDGGALYNGNTTNITNSTLSKNNSTRSGGAVSNRGSLTIRHSTLSGNIALEGGTIANYNGGTLQIGNTALKVSTFSPSIYNNSGTITSNGYNLISDNGGGFLTGPGDQPNTEPMLGPLQNNGGPTFTHELLTGSPAINAGNPSFAPPPANDQRGPLYQRVFNGRLDIGSLEVQPAPPTPTPTVTPTPTATATATATVPPPASPSPSSPGSPTPPPPPTATPSVTPFHDVDLVLTKTDSLDPVQVGHNLTYTITIANTFAHPAFNVNMSDTLPAGVNLVSVTPSQGSCTGTTTIFCSLADILHESSATVVVVVTPTVAGTLTNTATCTTTSQEFNLSNNSDTELTTVNPASAPTPTLTPTPTPTATATPTPTPTSTLPPPAAQALNLSTRMLVQTGENVGIGGFIITGTAPKHVLLRAIGSTLSHFGIPNPLADTVLELHGPPGFVTIINDNCEDGFPIIVGDMCIPGSGNSAIEATLDPGAYTAIVKGKNNTTGLALVEVYDLNQGVDSRLANLSTRAFVGTGADIVIAGVLLGGNSPQAGDDTVVVRGIGPSLANVGVPNPLANPRLELRDENGMLIASSDDWQADPICMLCKLGLGYLGPPNPLEAALVATLPPGAYTALLSGVNNGTGVGLVEVFDRVGQP